MTVESMRTEIRDGKNWREIHRTENYESCLYHFANALYRRALRKSPDIVRIRDKSHGDGRRTVTVTYSNGCRDVFEIRG